MASGVPDILPVLSFCSKWYSPSRICAFRRCRSAIPVQADHFIPDHADHLLGDDAGASYFTDFFPLVKLEAISKKRGVWIAAGAIASGRKTFEPGDPNARVCGLGDDLLSAGISGCFQLQV